MKKETFKSGQKNNQRREKIFENTNRDRYYYEYIIKKKKTDKYTFFGLIFSLHAFKHHILH